MCNPQACVSRVKTSALITTEKIGPRSEERTPTVPDQWDFSLEFFSTTVCNTPPASDIRFTQAPPSEIGTHGGRVVPAFSASLVRSRVALQSESLTLRLLVVVVLAVHTLARGRCRSRLATGFASQRTIRRAGAAGVRRAGHTRRPTTRHSKLRALIRATRPVHAGTSRVGCRGRVSCRAAGGETPSIPGKGFVESCVALRRAPAPGSAERWRGPGVAVLARPGTTFGMLRRPSASADAGRSPVAAGRGGRGTGRAISTFAQVNLASAIQ